MYRVRRLPSHSATPLFASLSLTPTLRRYHGGLRSDSYGDGGGGGGGGYGRGRGRGGGGGHYGQYPAYSRGGYTRGGGGGRSRGRSYTNVMTDDYPPHHPYGDASYSGELTPQQQQQQLPSASPAYGTQREMSAGNRLGAASPPSSLSSQPCRAFWSQTVRHVPTVDLKRQHVAARTHDKRSRFLVRSRIRDDGVLSNLFPLHFLTTSEAAEGVGGGNSLAPQRDAYVYVYEMYVTRLVSPGAGSATRPPGSVPPAAQKSPQQLVERRVYPGRSWRAIQRFLRHKYSVGANTAASPLPPLVQLENKIYAAAPLPADALRLPRTYYDVGWKTAELRLVSRSRLVELPPAELQMVVNKIVFEAARSTFRSRKRSPTAAALASDQKEVRRGGGEAEEAGGAGDGDGCGTLEVVREKTGKLVCTMQGVSSGGIRIYRGINVQAVFVDSTAAAALTCEEADTNTSGSAHSPHHHHHSSAAAPQSPRRPPAAAAAALQIPTRHLAETPVGLTSAPPIQFRVDAFLRAFTYRSTPVESYRFSDASGSVLASVWAPATPQSLVVGAVYTAAPVRIREFPERNNARLVELPAGTTPTLVRAPEAAAPPAASPAASTRPEANAQTEGSVGLPALPSRQPGHISLKIDTKGTIAAELSVWGEVLQHYGPGPYDGATQQRIQKALVDMPVVISYSLRQGIIRDIRFDGEALLTAASASAASDTLQRSLADGEGAGGDVKESGDTTASRSLSAAAPLSSISAREPRLLSLLPYLDAQQPCAVLNDGTLVPLQVLHCCFDPAMRSWQDVASAVLSLMPDDRMALLTVAQDLLAAGLRRWGIVVARTPWRTKALSLLPAPMKAVQPRHAMPLAIPGAAAFPSTVAVIGIAGPRCTDDQTQRVAQTAQHMAQYLRTRLVACLSDESSAVQYVHDHLMHNSSNAAGGGGVSVPISSPSSSQLRDVNTSVVVITTEPDTRATRWLKVECLSRGIHLITLPPSSSPRKLNVLCAGIRRQIATQFELDPLRGVDLRAEVPVLGRRTVLIIGVDTCHTNAHSIGTIVGIVSTPHGNHLLSHFWKHAARGREASQVAVHFRTLLQKAVAYYGAVHEVIVFQDGDVFSELAGMKDELAAQLPGCGLTFMCLHKRCNVRFTHHTQDTNGDASSSSSAPSSRSTHGGAYRDTHSREAPESAGYHNLVKGVVITALAPVPLDFQTAAPSFYLQAHESALSTARAVQYTVHHVSPTLDVADVQQMANVMANVMAPQATKLPMSTRCAHRLADRAERLLDAVPQLTSEMIPRPLSDRLWFL